MSLNELDKKQWFAACPKGIEALLAAELATLGAGDTRETVAGVYFDGPLALAYRACMWSRLANRVLLPLAALEATDGDVLYQELKELHWAELFGPQQSFAIDFSGQNPQIRNTQFGAQRSKDGIVDWFSEKIGRRPSVARKDPDIRLNIRLVKNRAVLSLDFSGGSLHQRGYRLRGGAAPLKENLAAAILLRADWPGIAARGGALIDPMCGSATLLLEGALMVADIAPGLNRGRFGFEHWRGHNARQWQAILADARSRAEQGRASSLPDIRGYDADPRIIRTAQENIARIGLDKVVRVSCKAVADLKKPTHRSLPLGLLVCNPPYGERLGDKESLGLLYRQLGEVMMREFSDWQAAIFTSDLDLGRATGLRSHKRYALWNGPIATSLLLFDLAGNELRDPATSAPDGSTVPDPATRDGLTEGARMFANRIRKNRKRLAKWLRTGQVECYRLYDADMPEYAVAVDIYGEHVHVAEYQAPGDVDDEAAARRLEEIRMALPEALGVPAAAIVYKQRRRQRGTGQYEKQGNRGELVSVVEGRARLLVNLQDYLDTGLFLDHRPLRLRIGAEAAGKDFLNLFCYTGSATVHAALGGARSTTSIDMSNTYLAWLRKSLAHNGLDESSNLLVKADCLHWLQEGISGVRPSGIRPTGVRPSAGRPSAGRPSAGRPPAGSQSLGCQSLGGQSPGSRYDLVLLDPPSFSNSTGMAESFDIQRDHAELIRAAMPRVRESGQLYFSSNRRGFTLDPTLPREYLCEDITGQTVDPDFQRNRKIHCCWLIRHWVAA